MREGREDGGWTEKREEEREKEHDELTSEGWVGFYSSFLLTLYILKALCTECRRDLALFSSSVIKCVDYALDVKVAGEAGKQSEGRDLEILARAGTVVSFLSFLRGLEEEV